MNAKHVNASGQDKKIKFAHKHSSVMLIKLVNRSKLIDNKCLKEHYTKVLAISILAENTSFIPHN